MVNSTVHLKPRTSHRVWQLFDVPPGELEHPKPFTVLKLWARMFVHLCQAPAGVILFSAILLLLLWGHFGNVEVLRIFWKSWAGPGSDPNTRTRIIQGIPWDQEWISFAIGAVLLVAVPCLLIVFYLKHDLADPPGLPKTGIRKLAYYGLGLPKEGAGRLTVWSTLWLFVIAVGGVLLVNRCPDMRKIYPLYHGHFSGIGPFLIYELGYFFFFVAIEFIFRGYLLFGLFHAGSYHTRATPSGEGAGDGHVGLPWFGIWAIFVSMLSYTAWHLGKPPEEAFSTLVWGVAAGTVALLTGTIWPIIGVHWLANVLGDFLMAFH